MITGYEAQYYKDISKIQESLRDIADLLFKINESLKDMSQTLKGIEAK